LVRRDYYHLQKIKGMINLTAEQQSALDKGEPVRTLAPEIGKEVVVLRADLYDTIRDLLQEERELKRISEIGMKNALGREQEDP
jgi:hypothetical protein